MNTSIILGQSYKVPHGFELPFAGRWLTAVGKHPGAVDFTAAGGRFLSLGNGSADLLAKNAEAVRADAVTGSASPPPTYAALMGALEQIWLSGHPDAPDHVAELAGITEAEFANRLVRIAGEALGRI